MPSKKNDHLSLLVTLVALPLAAGLLYALFTFRYPNSFLQATLSIVLGGLISFLVSFHFFSRQEESSKQEAMARKNQFTTLVTEYDKVVKKLDNQSKQRDIEFEKRSREFKDQILYKTRLSRFQNFLDTNENWEINPNQEDPEFQFLNFNLGTVFTNKTETSFFNLKTYSIETMKKVGALNRGDSTINKISPGESFEIFLNTMHYHPDGVFLVWEQAGDSQDGQQQENVLRVQALRFDPNLSMRGFFYPDFYDYDLSGLFLNKSITLPGDLVAEESIQPLPDDEKIQKSIDENLSWIINYYSAYKESQDSGRQKSFSPPENLTRSELEKYVRENFERNFNRFPPDEWAY